MQDEIGERLLIAREVCARVWVPREAAFYYTTSR